MGINILNKVDMGNPDKMTRLFEVFNNARSTSEEKEEARLMALEILKTFESDYIQNLEFDTSNIITRSNGKFLVTAHIKKPDNISWESGAVQFVKTLEAIATIVYLAGGELHPIVDLSQINIGINKVKQEISQLIRIQKGIGRQKVLLNNRNMGIRMLAPMFRPFEIEFIPENLTPVEVNHHINLLKAKALGTEVL